MLAFLKRSAKKGLHATGLNPLVVRYRAALAAKQTASAARSWLPARTLSAHPPVTLLMVNFNTPDATELALRTLRARTRYPDFAIWVADNASTDGSCEHLRTLRAELDFRLIESDTPRQHAEWLDDLSSRVTTPFWFAVDSDMLFLHAGWLTAMMAAFLETPDLFLLNAEPVAASICAEPVSGEIVDARTHPSTWLFGVRTALRDHLDTSFTFHREGRNAEGHRIVYDTGGKLLADMSREGLAHATMPASFQLTYHHFGGLSWGGQYDMEQSIAAFKAHQHCDIQHRVRALRAAS